MFEIAKFEQLSKKYPKSYAAYQVIKPVLLKRFQAYLGSLKVTNKGRKMTTNLAIFFDALFDLLTNGTKISYLSKNHQIPKATFYRYFNHLSDSCIFQQLNDEAVNSRTPADILISDTFTVKSLAGSQGTGPNSTDRGRKGLKVSLVADINGLITEHVTSPANRHDSKLLPVTLTRQYGANTQMLLDSAYVGKPVTSHLQSQNINAVVVPKKMSNSKPSHVLDPDAKKLIKNAGKLNKLLVLFALSERLT